VKRWTGPSSVTVVVQLHQPPQDGLIAQRRPHQFQLRFPGWGAFRAHVNDSAVLHAVQVLFTRARTCTWKSCGVNGFPIVG
jgi:hypothetical protein